MKPYNILTEKEKEITRQEQYARENFIGVTDMGESLLEITDVITDLRSDFKSKMTDAPDEAEEIYKTIQELNENFSFVLKVLKIKLSASFGHALNGKSTKTLRDIFDFMSEYSINDLVFKDDMARIVHTRSISTDNIIILSSIVAAQIDDLEFIKYLEDFTQEMKNRTSGDYPYDNLDHENRKFCVPSTPGLSPLKDTKRIAFESLIFGSERIYRYYTGENGLSDIYLEKFVTTSENSWSNKKNLTKEEVAKVITLEPKMINIIVDNMPENLPDSLVDIFIF